jgi:PAS domain S-box-containing protein
MNYDTELINKLLLEGIFGALVSNVLVPLIIVYVFYDFVPLHSLLLLLLTFCSLFVFRVYFHFKLKSCIVKKSEDINHYLIMYIVFISMSALLLGLISWIGIYYDVPAVNLIIVTAVITSVVSGAITTLGPILIAFLSYIALSVLPLIFALLYRDDSVLHTLAGVLCVYIVINVLLGIKFYKSNKYSNELQKKFKILYDESSDGIALMESHEIVECNDSLVKMFGCDDKAKFLQTPLATYNLPKQPDGEPSLRKMLKMLKIARKNTVSFELMQKRIDGKTFWVEIVLSPVEINRKRITYGVWRNIDSRKEVEEKIKDLNQNLEKKIELQLEDLLKKDQQLQHQSRLAQMGEMISMIAHQWRQPLTAISAASGAMSLKARLGKLDKDTTMELAGKISTYAQHLSSTINDFRDFFKSNKEKSKTSYDEIVNSVLGIVEMSIKNKNIKILKELNAHDVFESYPNELRQVVLNLIKNAEDILLEKKVKNPTIFISTYKRDSSLVLEVSDNAGGIPDEILPKIFDPYFSTKTKKDGTGLGLYMSKTIIEEHCKGTLSADNNANGAVFTVELEAFADDTP